MTPPYPSLLFKEGSRIAGIDLQTSVVQLSNLFCSDSGDSV